MKRFALLVLFPVCVARETWSQSQADSSQDVSSVIDDRGSVLPNNCPSKDGLSGAAVSLVANGDYIELQRTTCYGTCPSYTVRIHGDGTVGWRGEDYVRVKGDAVSQVDATKAKALIQEAQSRGFSALCGGYERSVTDSATTFTTLSINGQVKRVKDYAGAAPQWLQPVDTAIDRLANTHRWRHGDAAEERFESDRLREDAFMPKSGVTPLMRAAVQQGPEEIAALLKAGQSINAEDASGWTALMYAAQQGKLESVRLLLNSGARAGHRSKEGETALFAAVSSWNDPVDKARLLTKRGTQINLQDKHGISALMIAAQHYWMPELVSTMIELGADRCLRNADGQTALDLLTAQAQVISDPQKYGEVKPLLALP